jgi:hypothetical protein
MSTRMDLYVRVAAGAVCWIALPSALLAACPTKQRGHDEVAQAIIDRDAAAFAALIDIPAMAALVTAGLPADDQTVKELPKGLENGRMKIARGFMANIGEEVFVEQPGAGKRTLLRKQGKNLGSGVDYLEFKLTADGCVFDWTSMANGGAATDLMRQNILLTRDDAGILARVFGIERVDAQQVKQLVALGSAIGRADQKAAVQALDGMKSLARNSYELTMLRVTMLSRDPHADAYEQALADLAERFGDDHRTQFMLIDHYVLTRQFDRALAAIEHVQALVGKDEENELTRASILKMMGREDDAVIALRSMVQIAPERADTHGVLVANLADFGRHGEAVAAMEAATLRNVEFSEEIMSSEPVYASLLVSPEYAEFRAARSSR